MPEIGFPSKALVCFQKPSMQGRPLGHVFEGMFLGPDVFKIIYPSDLLGQSLPKI